MHFHRKSPCFNGAQVLLILVVTFHTYVTASPPSQEEINDLVVLNAGPTRFCGKRLTEAMRHFCVPQVKAAIMLANKPQPVKKSCKRCCKLFSFRNSSLLPFLFFSGLRNDWIRRSLRLGAHGGGKLQRRHRKVSLRALLLKRHSVLILVARQPSKTTRNHRRVLQEGLLRQRIGPLLSTERLNEWKSTTLPRKELSMAFTLPAFHLWRFCISIKCKTKWKNILHKNI